eukprot:5328924-Prymnesium_polylepis.2
MCSASAPFHNGTCAGCPQNNPLYIRAYDKRGQQDQSQDNLLRFHFIVHTALDFVEEKSARHPPRHRPLAVPCPNAASSGAHIPKCVEHDLTFPLGVGLHSRCTEECATKRRRWECRRVQARSLPGAAVPHRGPSRLRLRVDDQGQIHRGARRRGGQGLGDAGLLPAATRTLRRHRLQSLPLAGH